MKNYSYYLLLTINFLLAIICVATSKSVTEALSGECTAVEDKSKVTSLLGLIDLNLWAFIICFSCTIFITCAAFYFAVYFLPQDYAK